MRDFEPIIERVLLLTADQTARLINLSRSQFYRLQKTGRVPSPIKLGGAVRWARTELEAWVAAGCPSADVWVTLKEEKSK